MMRFKIGILDFKKNIMTYILLVIQLSAVMITIMLAFSSVRSRVRLYEPFSNYYQSNGLFSVMGIALDEERRPLTSTDYIKEKLIKTESIAGCYTCWTSADNMKLRFVAYDDEILEKFAPSLKKGKWITNDSYNIVVTKNNYNIDVGDKVSLTGKNGDKITFTVSGILNDCTPVPGILPDCSFEKISYKHFYCNYSVDYEENPLIIVPKHYSEFDYSIINQMLIKFSDDISDEEVNENISDLCKMGAIENADISSVKETSDQLVKNEIITLLPAIIGSVAIVMVSIICSAVLSTKRQIRNYTICYICGSRWKTCCFINLLQTSVISALSLFCTFTVLAFINSEKYQSTFYMDIRMTDIAVMILVLLVYAVLSFLIPLLILKKTNPISLLRAN